MNDRTEDRLASLLGVEAERLPPHPEDVGAVIARGQQRQRRTRLAGAGTLMAVVAIGVGLGGGAVAMLRTEPTETIAAAPASSATQTTASVGAGDGLPTASFKPQMPIMTIQPVPDEPDEPTASTSTVSTSTTQRPPTTAPTSTSTAPTTTRPTSPPSGQRSTDDVIRDLADDEVLFFSNNEGCRDIEDGQAHPDWMEGQPGSGRNDDGKPTYGFAYNTGDSRLGEISWAFEPQSFALSGDCVLHMGINDAYEERRAVRIFRRFDRHGQDLPTDGYYSMWFYFPNEVSYDDQANIGGETVYGFWNVFQIKNKIRGNDGSNETLSVLSFDAGKGGRDDAMSFHIWSKANCGRVEECDAAEGIDQLATPRPIPIGEWVHLEMHLVSRSDRNGRIEVWQDGVKIFDFTGVTGRAGADRVNWSVNSYGRLHHQDSHLFADDALISTRPIHPLLFD